MDLDTFRLALREDPDDVATHLALCDWLDEQQENDPRAIFHRIQWTTAYEAWRTLTTIQKNEKEGKDRQLLLAEKELRATMDPDALDKIARALMVMERTRRMLNRICVIHPDTSEERQLITIHKKVYEALLQHKNHLTAYFPDPMLREKIDKHPFPVRMRKVLNRLYADDHWQLTGIVEDEVIELKNCGQVTQDRIREYMCDHRLSYAEELKRLKY